MHVRTPAGVKKYGLPIGTVIKAKPGQTLKDAAKELKAAISTRGIGTPQAVKAMVSSPKPGDTLYTKSKKGISSKYVYVAKTSLHPAGWHNEKTGAYQPSLSESTIDTWVKENGEGSIWGIKTNLTPGQQAPAPTALPKADAEPEEWEKALMEPEPGTPLGKSEADYKNLPVGAHVVGDVPWGNKGVEYVKKEDGWYSPQGGGPFPDSGMVGLDNAVTGSKADQPKPVALDSWHQTQEFTDQPVGAKYVGAAKGQSYVKTAPNKWAWESSAASSNTDFGMAGAFQGHFEPMDSNAPVKDMLHSNVSAKDAPVGSVYTTPSSTGIPVTYTKDAENEWSSNVGEGKSTDSTVQAYITYSKVTLQKQAEAAPPPVPTPVSTSKHAAGEGVASIDDLESAPDGTVVKYGPTNNTYTKQGNGMMPNEEGSGTLLPFSNFEASIEYGHDQLTYVSGPEVSGAPKPKTLAKAITHPAEGDKIGDGDTVYTFTDGKWVPPSVSGKDPLFPVGMKNHYKAGHKGWTFTPASPKAAPKPTVGKHKPADSDISKSKDITSRFYSFSDVPSNYSEAYPTRNYSETVANFGTTYTANALTGTQTHRIAQYTGSWAGTVNSDLRNGHTPTGTHDMDGAMRPIEAPATFYRSAPTTSVGVGSMATSQDVFDALKKLEGKEISDKGFFSTSYDLDGNTVTGAPFFVIRVRAPKGTPAVFAQPFSSYQSEHEVILSRGLPMKVNKVEWNRSESGNNTFILDVTAEPDKIDPKVAKYLGKQDEAPAPKSSDDVSVNKLVNSTEEIDAYPVGTVMKHSVSGNTYTKADDGTWVKHYENGEYPDQGGFIAQDLAHDTYTVTLPKAKSASGKHSVQPGTVTQDEAMNAPVGTVFHAPEGDYTKTDPYTWTNSNGHGYGTKIMFLPDNPLSGNLELPTPPPDSHKAKVAGPSVEEAKAMLDNPQDGDVIAFKAGNPVKYDASKGGWVNATDDNGTAYSTETLKEVLAVQGKVWAVKHAKKEKDINEIQALLQPASTNVRPKYGPGPADVAPLNHADPGDTVTIGSGPNAITWTKADNGTWYSYGAGVIPPHGVSSFEVAKAMKNPFYKPEVGDGPPF